MEVNKLFQSSFSYPESIYNNVNLGEQKTIILVINIKK